MDAPVAGEAAARTAANEVPTRNHASVAKPRTAIISTGVSIGQVADGTFYVSAHDGDARVIVQVTGDELRELARQVAAFPALAG
jgi:hypothetical protein